MANSKDILLSCYDGKILALVDSKKFRKDGIMAPENPVVAGEEPTEAQNNTSRIIQNTVK